MDPITQLEDILPRVCGVVDQLEPSDLDRPTPCDEFTVEGVLDHMITLGGAFSYWFRGEQAPTQAPARPADGVPAVELRVTMESLLDAVRSPGALERSISAPVGTMPGETFARLVAFDGLVHGWDLASSTGADFVPPADVVAVVDQFARAALTADMRDGDTFKDPTDAPAGASPLERLVAFSGRRV